MALEVQSPVLFLAREKKSSSSFSVEPKHSFQQYMVTLSVAPESGASLDLALKLQSDSVCAQGRAGCKQSNGWAMTTDSCFLLRSLTFSNTETNKNTNLDTNTDSNKDYCKQSNETSAS